MTNNPAPPYLTSICPPIIASTSRYVTRYSHSIWCKTSLFKNYFLPSTIIHWNGLDIDERNSNSLNIFKSKLKLHFRFSPPLTYILYTGYRKASIYHTWLRSSQRWFFNKCNTLFSYEYGWAIHFLYYFHDSRSSSGSKKKKWLLISKKQK